MGHRQFLEEETGDAEEGNQEFGTSSAEQGGSIKPVAGANWKLLRASEPNDAQWGEEGQQTAKASAQRAMGDREFSRVSAGGQEREADFRQVLWALKRWLCSGAQAPQRAVTEMARTSEKEDWVSYGMELQAGEEVELREVPLFCPGRQ